MCGELGSGAAIHASLPTGRLACSAASVSNVIPFKPRPRASAASAAQCDPGIRRRDRQLLTTGASKPRSRATWSVPPRSSMIESTVMPHPYFTKCEVVKIHDLAGDFSPAAWPNDAMARPFAAIGKRLLRAREALGISQADVCRAIDVKPNRYSQYESGERRITLPVAIKLADSYGITLDYIYRNDVSALPVGLHQKIQRAA